MFVLSAALRDIFHTVMARYSLFVLKVTLNTKQTNEHMIILYNFVIFA